VPSVRISPSLDDVQSAINRAAVAILECSKKTRDWGQQLITERMKKTFFDILGKDLGIIKVGSFAAMGEKFLYAAPSPLCNL
jgi:dynein heavy chain, axonemal